MSNMTLIVASIVGVLIVSGMIFFKYILGPLTSRAKDPVMPNNSQEAINYDEYWRRLGVDPWIVKNIEKSIHTKILPDRLEEIARSVNKNLITEGFEFQMTHCQILDVLVSQDQLRKLGRQINVLEASICLWLDQYIRRESKERDDKDEILSHEEISPKYFKKYFDALVKRAKNRKESLLEKQQPAPGVKGSPVIANSMEDLVRQEAEFQTRKILKLSQQDNIPPDKKEILTEQLEIAKEKCQKSGYNISQPSQGDV